MGTYKFRKHRGFVYAVYTQDRKRFRVSTGVKIPDRYWVSNKLSKGISGYSMKVEVMESVMSELMETVVKIREQGMYPSAICVRKYFRKMPAVLSESLTYPQFCVRYLKFKSSKVSPRSIANTRQMFRVL